VIQQQRPGMLWTVNRAFALALGIVFTLLGIIGFLTPVENQTGVQHLLGLFDVDLTHNIIHLGTGLLGIMAALVGQARTFNQVFGVIYTALGILGLFPFLYFPIGSYGQDAGLFLGLVHMNAADHVLHLITGIPALIVGFSFAGSATPSSR